MIQKYNAILVSIKQNGKSKNTDCCISQEYIGCSVAVCIIESNCFASGTQHIVVFDDDMKSIVSNFGIVSESGDMLIFTTKDTIYTFFVKT